jgi:hypothetical protein
MAKTIILKAPEMTIQKERPLKGSVDITPGMLCAIDGADVKPHAVAGGRASALFAVENDIVGDGIDTAYSTDGETVLLRSCSPGVEVNAFLKTGHTVAIGDLLESDGAGALQPFQAAVGSGVKASATVAGAAANGGLTFQAKVAGEAGNAIQVVLNDAAGAAALTVSGTLITITPITSGNTATAVAAQVAANAGAAALILAVAEGTGAGEPGVSTGIQLSGGQNAYPVARALEAKANATGANVRVKVEVL